MLTTKLPKNLNRYLLYLLMNQMPSLPKSKLFFIICLIGLATKTHGCLLSQQLTQWTYLRDFKLKYLVGLEITDLYTSHIISNKQKKFFNQGSKIQMSLIKKHCNQWQLKSQCTVVILDVVSKLQKEQLRFVEICILRNMIFLTLKLS